VRNIKSDFDAHLANIDIKFTRRNYENTLVKSQVLVNMLQNEKIAPRLAFVYSGMFSDPEAAWKESMQYYEENQKKETETAGNAQNPINTGNDTENRNSSEQGLSGGSED
jgi:hypothetical protein